MIKGTQKVSLWSSNSEGEFVIKELRRWVFNQRNSEFVIRNFLKWQNWNRNYFIWRKWKVSSVRKLKSWEIQMVNFWSKVKSRESEKLSLVSHVCWKYRLKKHFFMLLSDIRDSIRSIWRPPLLLLTGLREQWTACCVDGWR